MNTANNLFYRNGGLAELVDAYALGAYDFGHESSSLLSPTKSRLVVELVSTPDLLVTKTSHSNNTRRYKFVARDVVNDKRCCNYENGSERGVVLADTVVLGTSIERCEGSSPFSPTNKLKKL